MNTEKYSQLIQKACEARKCSYSPYSNYSVGAALLCADGTVYTGSNIENASFTPTVCAERVAFFRAIHDGHRDFTAIAVIGGKNQQDPDAPAPPCGVCRQVIGEFCSGDFQIILSDGKQIQVLTLDELLPHRFHLT